MKVVLVLVLMLGDDAIVEFMFMFAFLFGCDLDLDLDGFKMLLSLIVFDLDCEFVCNVECCEFEFVCNCDVDGNLEDESDGTMKDVDTDSDSDALFVVSFVIVVGVIDIVIGLILSPLDVVNGMGFPCLCLESMVVMVMR